MQKYGKILAEDREGGWDIIADDAVQAERRPKPFACIGVGGAQDAALPSDVNRSIPLSATQLAAATGASSRSTLMAARQQRAQLEAHAFAAGASAAQIDQLSTTVPLSSLRTAARAATAPGPSISQTMPRTVDTRSQLHNQRRLRQRAEGIRALGATPQDVDIQAAVEGNTLDATRTAAGASIARLSGTAVPASRAHLLQARRAEQKQLVKGKECKVGLGVHRSELPKFAAGDKPWYAQSSAHLASQVGMRVTRSELDGPGTRDGPATGKRMGALNRPLASMMYKPEYLPQSCDVSARTCSLVDLRAARQSHSIPLRPTQVDHWSMDEAAGRTYKQHGQGKRRWTDSVIEHQQLCDLSRRPATDARGKAVEVNVREYEPMYSSFSRDGLFREPALGSRLNRPRSHLEETPIALMLQRERAEDGLCGEPARLAFELRQQEAELAEQLEAYHNSRPLTPDTLREFEAISSMAPARTYSSRSFSFRRSPSMRRKDSGGSLNRWFDATDSNTGSKSPAGRGPPPLFQLNLPQIDSGSSASGASSDSQARSARSDRVLLGQASPILMGLSPMHRYIEGLESPEQRVTLTTTTPYSVEERVVFPTPTRPLNVDGFTDQVNSAAASQRATRNPSRPATSGLQTSRLSVRTGSGIRSAREV